MSTDTAITNSISDTAKKIGTYASLSSFADIPYKMHLLLEIGQLLMENGTDSERIMHYLKRTAVYMGIPPNHLQIHITYTSILLNVSNPERTYTKIRKCRKHSVNMYTLASTARLIWRAMRARYSLNRFKKRIDQIKAKELPYTPLQTAIGSSFACGGSCLLFGGDLGAFFITAVCAFLGFFTRIFCNKHGFNPYASISIAAFVATLMACLSQQLHISATPMLPIVACALFMVPGVPLMNSAADMINNYINAGMTRAADTLLIISSMAFGTAIAMQVGQFSDFASLSLSPGDIYLYHPIAGAISAGGFSLLFNVPRRVVWVVAVGGMLTILIRNICMFDLGLSQAVSSFFGAASLGILALSAVRWFHIPNIVLTLPSAIPLIPGVLLYRSLFTLLNIDTISPEMLSAGVRSGIEAVTIIISITIGVTIHNIFFSRQIRRRNIEQERKLMESFEGD
ncbi:hypothetical protein TAMA11512_15230 [Selenomonas sp. TAMA-11512]|uniref:threonine/serine ThrE exporter family protein n=1 Tax=Selenomonas sp. TAMA-11512 TaxID=3095337 RepID=UPI0030868BD6|nr:hypothetical protein TAMA11512_15230 [Selenomonas sp. TAMA-11512]